VEARCAATRVQALTRAAAEADALLRAPLGRLPLPHPGEEPGSPLQTRGEKLVAVISHLHAVAEAVQDVLWVGKEPAGSAARWLGGAEVEALMRDDLGGLSSGGRTRCS
jgi:hypothetical protein